MMQDERREIDRVCLRLMGHKDLQWQDGSGGWWWAPTFGDQIPAPMSPSRQPAFVAPLVEALQQRGWPMGEISWDATGFTVSLERIDGPDVRAEGATMQEALAVAAARAVGAPAQTAVL